ncbi:DNA topoisomerase I [Leptospira inadai serovar Lyme str. 10]|uniref:DNA topoisomerase 1 n=2 Tax=Leptospira inadai serovar Lyme TaxID=293084 RepID=V6HAA0_9LEPT|nr:type I DNA topoisomerase [Leptospira inadai]EQA36281.1 DNA topoisomerase I [Leptospira inadai serovar Lyme str. 10]PNV75785.1 type I DNA topoisomerase [Leptospira inadai serovar Lyme]
MPQLLLVESPTKVRTLSSYLGGDFQILATFGHLVDLPSDRLGVDIVHDFLPEYELLPGKKKVLAQILKAAKVADRIFIATDPDREGEFIGSVLSERIGKRGSVKRVKFREISKTAVLEAVSHPIEIDSRLVESQVTRRILDRLIGYKISPFLWKAISSGLSAGRVQSVALKWICEREAAIRDFIPEDSWEVIAKVHFSPEKEDFILFRRKDGAFETEEEGKTALRNLLDQNAELRVIDRSEKKGKTPPPAPFTTASLQQEAFRFFKFPASKTLKLAQSLYEGVDLGNGKRQGLITYMRTDSVRISSQARFALKEEAILSFGAEFVSSEDVSHRERKAKGKTQDAHEAIRPVDPSLTPKDIQHLSERSLNKDAKKLYELIWKRSLASQMKPENWIRIRFQAEAGSEVWIGETKRTEFPGYRIVYGATQESRPPWKVGEILSPTKWEMQKKTTEPPPRYTEATLVAKMEKEGIGRPSTYASILETLYKRNYAIRDKIGILATNLGEKVNSFLQKAFPDLFRDGFTADMEMKLDHIAEGSVSRTQLLTDFYSKLATVLKGADIKSVSSEWKKTSKTVLGYGICPVCGKGQRIRKRSSKKKEYFLCSRFPDCDYAEYL